MESPTLPECNELIDKSIRTLGNLFRNAASRVSPLVGEQYLLNEKKEMYAVTVNLSPYFILNRKRWFTYKHDHQRNHLARLEAKLRELTPSIKLIELHYEVCPTEKEFHNIHFHALYMMPPVFKAEMEAYYMKYCKADRGSTWKHLDIQHIPTGGLGYARWIAYIRKDVKEL